MIEVAEEIVFESGHGAKPVWGVVEGESPQDSRDAGLVELVAVRDGEPFQHTARIDREPPRFFQTKQRSFGPRPDAKANVGVTDRADVGRVVHVS
jgi:hypothetical protein